MLKTLFAQVLPEPVPKEGDLYKKLTICGKPFEIRYGYYEEFERKHHEPMAIYPDFVRDPEYTDQGQPLVTAMQDVCLHYCGAAKGDTCSECRFFRKEEDLFGICTCPEREIENGRRATLLPLGEDQMVTST